MTGPYYYAVQVRLTVELPVQYEYEYCISPSTMAITVRRTGTRVPVRVHTESTYNTSTVAILAFYHYRIQYILRIGTTCTVQV